MRRVFILSFQLASGIRRLEQHRTSCSGIRGLERTLSRLRSFHYSCSSLCHCWKPLAAPSYFEDRQPLGNDVGIPSPHSRKVHEDSVVKWIRPGFGPEILKSIINQTWYEKHRYCMILLNFFKYVRYSKVNKHLMSFSQSVVFLLV